tara:strand:- start:699 stop:1274 length:576 start_codon:yes stop_codon:yes gene_type:complete
MKRIGILGPIGSGKSFFSKLFNYPIFNADQEVSKIYNSNKNLYLKLKKNFPKMITSYPIKKSEILKLILKNKRNIKKINKVVHAEVNSKLNKFLKKNKKRKFVILDIPLLLENKLNKKKDVLVFLDANRKDIMLRLRKRKNFNKKIFKILSNLQLSREYKKKNSQIIIKNDFRRKTLQKEVKKIINIIKDA